MKDATGSKRSRPNSDLDENDPNRGSSPKEKTEKQKRKKLRKRRSSSSPEEDVIDGFVIASYASLRSLEVTQIVTSNTPDCVPVIDQDQNDGPVEVASQVQKSEDETTRLSTKNKEETSEVKETEKAVAKKVTNGDVAKPQIDLSRQSPGQMTDDSSDSGNSGKGYICDGESEDEQVSEVSPEKRSKPTLTLASEVKKDIVPIELDLVKDEDDEPVKNEKSFEMETRRSTVSPKPSSFHTPSLSFSSSSSFTISQTSRPIPQSSWLPRLSSSSFKKPGVDSCCRSGAYSGSDVLHQELNNRFLQSHSDLERNHQHAKPSDHEMHQHSHLHHHQHQHQHQHTHYYPSPLLASPYYPPPTPVPGLLSPFSAPVPTYGSHMIPSFSKKTGKWCAAHVQIAWKIYCHQRVQGEMSKDHHGKPKGIAISKPTTSIIPPFPSRHVNPSDIGYHSHSSRFSVSPFGRPPVLIPRSTDTSTPTMTSSTSAFSSVSSPLLPTRRVGSPVAISRASSETHGRRSPISGPSTLYPWLKSEPKTPDLDSEKTKDLSKREFHTKSPARPINFSIQALAGDRAEIRSSPLGESTRTHSSREHRPYETRSFLDNPLVPSLGGLDKRPIDYRPSAGSIDLNRNSIYARYEPMPTLYPHHMAPMTPHISGYPYPSSSFLTDYHSAPRHPMVLGPRDPITPLVRTPDAPFYIMHDFDDRLGGRH